MLVELAALDSRAHCQRVEMKSVGIHRITHNAKKPGLLSQTGFLVRFSRIYMAPAS
jgi:hypothetical protein